MNPTAALASLLVATLGPIDVDERDLGTMVSTMLVLANRTEREVEVTFALEPPDWKTLAGSSTGRERLRPHQEVVLPVRGTLSNSLYPLPAVKATWTGAGEPKETRSLAIVRKRAEARRTRQPVQANGVLSEDCWLLSRRFGRFGSASGEKSFEPSPEWMAAYDDTNLYFGILCGEPSVASLVASDRGRDDSRIAEDESVEVYLDCAAKRARGFRLVVNAKGALLDERCTASPPEADPRWESKAQAAVQLGRERYYVELAVPLASLGADSPRLGTVWLINVARNQRLEGSEAPTRSQWNAGPGGRRSMETLGALVFK